MIIINDSTVIKSCKYRLYPNQKQKQLFEQTFGAARFVYNYFLNMRNQEYKVDFSSVSYKNCSSELTSLKKDEDHMWLNHVDSTALQSSLKNLDTAFKNFFEGRSKYPRFHSRKSGKFTYTSKCTNHNIEILKNHIKLPTFIYKSSSVNKLKLDV